MVQGMSERTEPRSNQPASDQAKDGRSKDCDPTVLRAGSAEDLLDIIPFLLGFHPEDSMVVVAVRRGRIKLSARSDLADGPLRLRDVARFVAASHDADALFLAVYSDDEAAAMEVLDLLVADSELPSIIDAVRTHGDRWWAREDAGSPGHPLGTGRLAAEAVFAGISVAADREEVVRSADPPAQERVAELTAVAEREQAALVGRTRKDRIAQARAMVTTQLDAAQLVGGARAMSNDDCVRLAVLVRQIAVRDAVWAMLTRENADPLVGLWGRVVSCSVASYQPAPLCLLGMAAWVSGNGALVVRCVERVSAVAPDYTLGQLLAEICQRAIPPKEWHRVAAELAEVVG